MTEQNAKAIQHYIGQHREELLEDLLTLVRAESPSTDKGCCDACAEVLAGLVKKRLGVECTRYEMPQNGRHLSAIVGEGKRRALLVGHYDTVWNVGTLPLSRDGNRLAGPGVYDMKYGDISAIWALRALQELKLMPEGSFELLFNSDEELGSPTSRPLIEEHARQASCVLILEASAGPEDNPAIKSSRKGVGMFQIVIHGLASHAGSDYQKGRSAILEAAWLTEQLFALTDLEKGTTVNVGVLNGGTKRNVIAARAEMLIDVRVTKKEEGERVSRAILALSPRQDGVTFEITGGMNRPPFEFTPGNRALYERAEKIAAVMGCQLRHTAVGGASDGNFTSALGIPTLDGLGAVGDGAHAQHEHILLQESLEATMRLAGYLSEL